MDENQNYLLLKNLLYTRLLESDLKKKILNVSIGGSIGRYETELFYSANNKFNCTNDFDILIISKNTLSYQEREKFENLIKEYIENEWIDFDFVNIEDRRLKRNSIWLYDFYFNNLHIYGIELKKIISKQIISSKISKWESHIMFKTRIFTLWSPEFYNFNKESHYQLSKLIFAIIDIISLSHNNYKSKYLDKTNYAIKNNLLKETLIKEAFLVKVRNSLFKTTNLSDLRDYLIKEYIKAICKNYFLPRLNIKLLILDPNYLLRKIRSLLMGDLKNSINDFLIFWGELKLIHKLQKGKQIGVLDISNQAQKRLIWMEKEL